MSSKTRVCRVCKKRKKINDFYKTGRKTDKDPNQRHTECKDCTKARVAASHKANPDAARDRHLRRLYGITLDDWNQMLADQGNCCFICKTTEPGGKHNQWSTDHCHDSNIVRALLCHHCNTTLGQYHENPLVFQSFINYIEHFSWTKDDKKRNP